MPETDPETYYCSDCGASPEDSHRSRCRTLEPWWKRGLIARWRSWHYWRGRRKACWHHLVFYSTDTHQKVVVSLVKSQLLDLGRDKMWWCDEAEGGCGKTWWL